MYLEFIAVPEDKVIENRVHRGCSAGTLEELEAEIERLPSLEPRSREVAARYRNVVLRDPEGNEFCLGAGVLPS